MVGRTHPGNGFRRLYLAAAAPETIRAQLEPGTATAGPETSQAQAAALATIVAVGETAPWTGIRPRNCAPSLAFALGLDKTAGSERMRAIVCRAYERADAFADAFAQDLEDEDFAKDAVKKLDQIIDELVGKDPSCRRPERHDGQFRKGDGLLQRSLKIIGRARPHVESPLVLYDDVRRTIAIFDEVRAAVAFSSRPQSLRHGVRTNQVENDGRCGETHAISRGGRTAGDARFFFVLRLAEAFALTTGQCPPFHGRRPKRISLGWPALIRAAMRLTGLGEEGLDALHRRLGDENKSRIDLFGSGADLRELATWFTPEHAIEQSRILGEGDVFALSKDFESRFVMPAPALGR